MDTEPGGIHRLLTARAGNRPEAVAVAAPERTPLTYGQLLDQVEKTAKALRAFGLKRNDRVAMVLPNGPEMAVAFLAVASAATAAPLNPSYRANEFDFYLSDLNAKAVIVWTEMDSPARDSARKRSIPVIELSPDRGGGSGLFDLAGPNPAFASDGGFAQPEDTALVLHTSGTTSRPKIVPLTHANICRSGLHIADFLALGEEDRCLNVMPLFHIHGLVGAVLSSVTAGASLVCTPGMDAGRFFGWLDSFHPSWYTAVPTMHQAILVRAPDHREIIARRPLRFIRSCSAPLPERVITALEEVFSAPVIDSYGMTEAAHQITSNPLPPRPRKAGSVGIAAGPEVAIMDEEGNLLPDGEVGEVVIRGANIMRGYENDPAANRGAFANGWFHTGDQGRIDANGYLFLSGRLKEIINRGGEKIAPMEVDEILMRHPAVLQAVSFAVPHPTLGEDIAAAVVLREGAIAEEGEIRDFAASRLVDFKVPAQVLIVEEIPKGPTGKLRRIGLIDKLDWKRRSDFVAPRTPVEKELAGIWKTLLHVDQVGLRDSFYALGGDSLSTAMLMMEMEGRFKTELPVDRFLRSPTVETVAGLIQEKESTAVSPSADGGGLKGGKPIRDTALRGLWNRVLQLLALYAPGFKTTRVRLHRMRGVSIGTNTSIGIFAIIESAYPRLVSIGNDVTIGMRAMIIGHLRDMTDQARDSSEPTVRIEDDVYIGPGVIVLPNVTIGQGAVVTAGSVVSRSVPPHTLVQGNPAVPIARCGVSLGGGVSYEQFLRHLTPIKDRHP
jgi:acyl-CoA synthetase (AMP-forming)/AMP-acid ligase II/acetyltransferase-like isoleucine patch superfamily enzyme/acyl carrier protein